MKASLHIWVAVTLLSVGTISAQKLPDLQSEYRSILGSTLTIPNIAVENPLLPGKDGPSTQALTYKWLFWTTFGAYFEYFNSMSPFIYEPVSSTLFLLKPEPISSQGQITGGRLLLMKSSNNGKNFSAGTEIANATGTLFLIPSLTISNPGNAVTNPDDLNWIAYASKYVYDAVDQNFKRSGQMAVLNSTGTPFPYEMNEVGDPSNFWWTDGDLAGAGGDNPTAFMAGFLDPQTGNGQYGTYGTWSFDYATETFPVSGIPSQWDNSQFRPAPSASESYNSRPEIGVDANGAAYMVVNNLFADNQDIRVPAVSVSENQGVSWTALDRMPVSVLDSYMSQVGWANINVYDPYGQHALVITGAGQFSYFMRVFQTDPNDPNSVLNIDIVEAAYDNGVWTLSRVAELLGSTPPVFLRADGVSDQVGQYAWLPQYLGNPQGHELQAALTADGQNILLTWIDINPARVTTFDPAITIYVVSQNVATPFTLDQLPTTDVYFSRRAISASTWSAPRNLTDDDNYDHGTHIPAVIPDLENVPLLTMKTILKSEYNSSSPWSAAIQSLPNVILSASIDYRTPNGVNTAVFDALNVNSVSEDQSQHAFRINDITPNPASESAALSFSMDVPASVSIDVYSVTGTLIKNVYNGSMDVGIKGMNIQTSDLASGPYYIMLTVNGVQVAKQLSVVK